jgi:hypothetical protein
MKAGEIWRVPLRNDQSALVRVVLAIKDLGLSAGHPMSFVKDCALVQIGQIGAASFDPTTVLIDGLFLSASSLRARKCGFERVGMKKAELNEVNFPSWLIDHNNKILICRGEICAEIQSADPKGSYKRWEIRLSPKYPAQLIRSIEEFGAVPENDEPPRKRMLGVAGSDIRYHPAREALLRDICADISRPYALELETLGKERVSCYARALA